MDAEATRADAEYRIVPFRTWLLRKYATDSVPDLRSGLPAFAFKVRMDDNWPETDVNLTVLMEYLEAKGATDVAKLSLFCAWTVYVGENFAFVTTKEVRDLKTYLGTPFLKDIPQQERETLIETLRKVRSMEADYYNGGVFDQGVRWDPR